MVVGFFFKKQTTMGTYKILIFGGYKLYNPYFAGVKPSCFSFFMGFGVQGLLVVFHQPKLKHMRKSKWGKYSPSFGMKIQKIFGTTT